MKNQKTPKKLQLVRATLKSLTVKTTIKAGNSGACRTQGTTTYRTGEGPGGGC